MPIDFSNEEVLAEIQQAGFMSKDQADEYAKKHNSAIEANKNDILNQLKDVKGKLNGLPVDPDTLSKLAEDKRFKKIVEYGIDAYEQNLDATTAQRLEALRTDKMMQEQDFLRKEQDYQQAIEQANNMLKHTKIENNLQNLIFSHRDEIVETAIPDLVQYAKQELDFDDRGNLAVKGEDGTFKQTADGAMTEKDWLKEKMKSKPHWFMGAAGSHNGRSKFGNVDTSKMSATEKMRLGRSGK